MASLSRDELIEDVKYGRMSPAEAEAAAAELRLPPFETTPNPRQFSPMEEVGWTLPMTVAWIAWRDPNKVLQFYDPYRAQCFDWHFRKWRIGFDGPVYNGHFLKERPAATLVLLSLAEQIDIAIDAEESGPPKVRAANQKLWKALQDGKLEATALPSQNAQRVTIPANEWHDLEAVEEQGHDVLRHGRMSPTAYKKIIIPRRSVLAVWPERRYLPEAFNLPPTIRPDGPGDFPLYCAAQWIATKGGTYTFSPTDASVWDAAIEDLKARIASGDVQVAGVRNGRLEKIEAHIFSSALRFSRPYINEPLDLILSDDLYLCPCVYIDATHWHDGFNDCLQTRAGVEWSKLTVLKSDVKRFWPFPEAENERNVASGFRTGAPGRPTPIHLVVAEHHRRLESGKAEISVTVEAEHLADWLKSAHPGVPPLRPKTIQNKIRGQHRAAKDSQNKNIG